MLILGLDPGANPGYALCEVRDEMPATPAGRFCVVRTSTVAISPPGPFVLVCERPQIRRGIDPRATVTLAWTAGQQFAEARRGATAAHALEPTKWKSAIYRGSIAKHAFIARLRVDLNLDARLTDDEVDAVGLCYATVRMGLI